MTREQCPEEEDVVEHKLSTEQNYESPDYLICSKNLKKVYNDGVAAVSMNSF